VSTVGSVSTGLERSEVIGASTADLRQQPTLEHLRQVAAAVPDPELPVLSLGDLGILRAVDAAADGSVIVTITPTYSGCPAMHAIIEDIERALHEAGCGDLEVRTVLAPAWTTDWMSEEGRRKLLDYGIAPPRRRLAEPSPTEPAGAGVPVAVGISVRCPQCGSGDTHELSRFGSTSCKSLWACRTCREPFDHFKSL